MSAWLASCNIMCIVLSRFDVRGRAVARAHASPTVNTRLSTHPPTRTSFFAPIDHNPSDGCVCGASAHVCWEQNHQSGTCYAGSLFAALMPP